MTVSLTPYLTILGGAAREAMQFYQQALGGELEIVTFAEGGMPVEGGDGERVMHAFLRTEAGWELMASDTGSWEDISGGGQVALALSGDDEPTLRRAWDALSTGEGASVQMPLEPAPWGGLFGQLTDRFGIRWMVNTDGPGEPGEAGA